MAGTQEQADETAFRMLRVNTATDHTAAPTDGAPGTGTDPDFILSPSAPGGVATGGFATFLAAAATAGAGGFSVTVWVRDPVSYRWSAFQAVSMNTRELFMTWDVPASELYFQIGNISVNGTVDIHVAEMG